MSSTFAEGDRVRVVDRDVTAADVKSQLFFEHYRGLVGNVRKVYTDSTIAVAIAMDDLPVSHSKRHNEVTDWVRGRELERLSEEAKNKLNAGDKKFAVPYAILVSVNDLVPAGADDHSGKAAGLPETPVRKSLAQLEEEEARHLDAVQRKQE